MYALIDCNNFYASCERVFNPKVNYKPIIVLSNNDGWVIARSNEAKLLGIQMGEPAFKIKSIINRFNVYVYSTNFALYGDMSNRVMSTIASFNIDMEIYSIDEVFLDLSTFKEEDFFMLAYEIKNKIKKWTGIPVSIGIAKTKTLSKAANYIAKKNNKENIFIINDSNVNSILNKISLSKIWGIGPKSYIFLRNYNLKTALDLKCANLVWIKHYLNISGEKTIKELRGEPCISMETMCKSKQSISTSRTFGTMVTDYKELVSSISLYIARCCEKLRSQNSYANFITVFIHSNKYRVDLNQHYSSKVIKFRMPTCNAGEMISSVVPILKTMYKFGYHYKKAGVILSGIIPNNTIQQNLFESFDNINKTPLLNTIDTINKKMGRDVIRYAVQGYKKNHKLKQQKLSPCYTTRWKELLNVRVLL